MPELYKIDTTLRNVLQDLSVRVHTVCKWLDSLKPRSHVLMRCRNATQDNARHATLGAVRFIPCCKRMIMCANS